MLLRPVLPHIIGRDFIIRPTHFTNCQNVKPTTARIAHIPSAADRHEKTKSRTSDFYPNDNLYPSFVHTLTDEKAIEPHTVHRHVSFIPEFADILISISVTRTTPNKRKKFFFLRLKNYSLEIETHIYRKRPHICSLKLIFIQNPRFPVSFYPVFTSQKRGKSCPSATKTRTNAAICQFLLSLGTNRPSRRQKKLCRKTYTSIPAQPYRMFLIRNRNLILTSSRPYFRLRSHSDSCGNTQPALS